VNWKTHWIALPMAPAPNAVNLKVITNIYFSVFNLVSVFLSPCHFVNGGAICDQKNSKFFVSHQKEFMAGQGIY
jgi:hypothetical protein